MTNRNAGRCLMLCTAMLALGGCSASPYYVMPSKTAFLPQKGPQQTLGQIRLTPDKVLFEAPVGYRRAARLDQPVAVAIIGKSFAFAPGDMLVTATITGASSGLVPPTGLSMCGSPKTDLAKSLLSASTLGITSLLARTGPSSQICLIDAEGDGRVEKAILAGVKSTKDAIPVKITPASYTLIENEPMPGESAAKISYRGKTGMLGGHVSFDLAVVEQGTPLFFNNVRTKVDIKKLPQTVTLMGTLFTVQSYDSNDGSVLVDVARGFSEGEYGITTTTTTTYIPIYVPG